MPPTRSSTQDLDVVAEQRVQRHAWVELACQLCGDMVGILLDYRVIRPRAVHERLAIDGQFDRLSHAKVAQDRVRAGRIAWLRPAR